MKSQLEQRQEENIEDKGEVENLLLRVDNFKYIKNGRF